MWTIVTSVYTPHGWRFRTWRIVADDRIEAVAHAHGIVVSAMYEPSQQYSQFADGLAGLVGRAA